MRLFFIRPKRAPLGTRILAWSAGVLVSGAASYLARRYFMRKIR